MSKWEIKSGELSRYAFICGYIQEKFTSTKHVQLYEDGIYQVKAFDIDNPYNRLYWESFESLGEARKAFKQLIKE